MDELTQIMLDDAKRYLVPKLRRIVPVNLGHLKRSLGVREYRGRWKREADNPNYFLVQKIELYIGRASAPHRTIVVGSVSRGGLPAGDGTKPARYGHILFADRHPFGQRWLRIAREYERGLSDRLQRQMASVLGLT